MASEAEQPHRVGTVIKEIMDTGRHCLCVVTYKLTHGSIYGLQVANESCIAIMACPEATPLWNRPVFGLAGFA